MCSRSLFINFYISQQTSSRKKFSGLVLKDYLIEFSYHVYGYGFCLPTIEKLVLHYYQFWKLWRMQKNLPLRLAQRGLDDSAACRLIFVLSRRMILFFPIRHFWCISQVRSMQPAHTQIFVGFYFFWTIFQYVKSFLSNKNIQLKWASQRWLYFSDWNRTTWPNAINSAMKLRQAWRKANTI